MHPGIPNSDPHEVWVIPSVTKLECFNLFPYVESSWLFSLGIFPRKHQVTTTPFQEDRPRVLGRVCIRQRETTANAWNYTPTKNLSWFTLSGFKKRRIEDNTRPVSVAHKETETERSREKTTNTRERETEKKCMFVYEREREEKNRETESVNQSSYCCLCFVL